MLKGSIPALITPFTQKGEIDEEGFERHVSWQIESGSTGVVPVGTTGESPTLTHAEHKHVIERCVAIVNGRVPVIAGAGSNSTFETIDLVQYAESAGADAALVVTPYYNKPTQAGLYAHYAAVARASSLPIVIYNIPGRSVVDMSTETMAALHHDFPSIIGVKDSTGRMERVSEQRMACGKEFFQVSGEDASALGFNAHGGHGAISVTANVAPALCAEFQAATLEGDFVRALEYQDRLMPLHRAIFLEPGVCGVKYALSRFGRVNEIVRSPLLPVSEPVREAIDIAMRHAGLLD
ncbi:4-hydroxy-tetrahydrodipicolinate synthase [Pararhizobium mangrovi]|uniref:4-hydroxy-tetrahydrodipicolinate synthase n=1 Tax=Pararhizobium mangrovi TaxID=2590452 RepID=A0A506UC38_9HYPH|nr:4-hydroxy-tetrahydrodipicolinate synthase [Pararhizobium mangrovi]TPW31992.1 4-hydroxy-tetrahydrodipicolinate synthase [Pararhizobium mangrovi]